MKPGDPQKAAPSARVLPVFRLPSNGRPFPYPRFAGLPHRSIAGASNDLAGPKCMPRSGHQTVDGRRWTVDGLTAAL